MNQTAQELVNKLEIQCPIIGGAMYPCSNPELVAAVSEAGGIGVIQPISMEYVYDYKLRDGIQYIRTKTQKPIGMNILIEGQSKKYLEKTHQWLDIALEEGLRFFVTALGKPDSFVEKIKKYDGVVFHNTTEKKWAQKAMQSNVDGFICVNNLAGGHAGTLSPKGLFEELKDLDLPMICAGGVGDRPEYIKALELGYAGVQVGTRFIASKESMASDSYKKAIVNSDKEDIVLTNHLTGIPVSVINTPYIQKVGTQHGGLMRFLLKHPKTKHYTRAFLSLKSFWALKKSMKKEEISKDYWQAGKSVEGIKKVISVNEIIQDWVRHS